MNRVDTHEPPAWEPIRRSTPPPALNRGDAAQPAAAQLVDFESMKLLTRDVRILTAVARFGQLTTAQIQALEFSDSLSRTPCDRALKRLVDAELLDHVAQRHPGGRTGGSAMNVFQLGAEGWRMFYEGRRKVGRVIRAHSLAIADVFVSIKQAEREGWLQVLHYSTEPDSHVDVAGADLRPDLYIEIGLVERRERVALWLEVDMGTERQKQIMEKLGRYKYARSHAESFQGESFPDVVFMSPIDERVDELKRMVERTAGLPDGYVSVMHIDSFPQSLR